MSTTKRADELQPGDRVHWRGDTRTVEGSNPSQVSGLWHIDLGDEAGGIPADHLFVMAVDQ